MTELRALHALPAPISVGGHGESWQVHLVNVPSGVAAGRTLRLSGNARLEWWALFSNLEQVDVCATKDPLRFAEPIRFARINREFNNAFHSSRPDDVHTGARTGR